MQILTHLLPLKPTDELVLAWNRVEDKHPKEILTSDERREYDGFKSGTRKQEYLATRRLIWDMVEHLNLDPAQFLLQKDEFGNPSGLYQKNEYKISIAHTNRHVLCAISPEIELGVDMEPKSRKVPDRLRDRVLNSDEVELIKGEQTIRIWTIKEAMVKLQGQGMRTNLNDCTLLSARDSQFIATFNDDNRAKICSFVHENHWLAIAWNI
ncbi:MAG: 4'-phosphopantetheinyl transferase superfamily protein [Balneolaceae bacterium]|nr:4'-phosphopantetheinyl transferase superfamily protein [Balneolaceae bacterium]